MFGATAANFVPQQILCTHSSSYSRLSEGHILLFAFPSPFCAADLVQQQQTFYSSRFSPFDFYSTLSACIFCRPRSTAAFWSMLLSKRFFRNFCSSSGSVGTVAETLQQKRKFCSSSSGSCLAAGLLELQQQTSQSSCFRLSIAAVTSFLQQQWWTICYEQQLLQHIFCRKIAPIHALHLIFLWFKIYTRIPAIICNPQPSLYATHESCTRVASFLYTSVHRQYFRYVIVWQCRMHGI